MYIDMQCLGFGPCSTDLAACSQSITTHQEGAIIKMEKGKLHILVIIVEEWYSYNSILTTMQKYVIQASLEEHQKPNKTTF